VRTKDEKNFEKRVKQGLEIVKREAIKEAGLYKRRCGNQWKTNEGAKVGVGIETVKASFGCHSLRALAFMHFPQSIRN